MTTAYTSLLGLALPVTGELSGTWGDTVNNAITSLLDSAVAGTTNISTDGDVTLTTTTGAANQAREAILLFSGARTALRTVTAPAQSKIYTVINATTGGYAVKLVGAGPTTGVTIVAGESAVCAWNGSDFVKVSNAGGSSSFVDLTVSGNLTLSGGTANGVAYLNGSKVVTSGSALTYNGTGLGIGISSAGYLLDISTPLTGTTVGSNVALNLESQASGRDVEIRMGDTVNASGRFGYLSGSLYWAFGSSESMRLTSTGLGIGTSSPSTKLHVKGAVVSNFGVLTVQDSGGSGTSAYPVIALYDSASTHQGDLGMFAGDQVVSNLTSTGKILFKTNSTTVGTIDSSGNLGLGVTPSAWGSGRSAMQLNARMAIWGDTTQTLIGNNVYGTSSGDKYIATAAASLYAQNSGAHAFFTAASGTAGNAITFTQAMTIDASAQLQIGTTTASGKVTIDNTGASTPLIYAKSADQAGARIALSNTGSSGQTWQIVAGDVGVGNSGLSFYDGTATRARIDSSGNLLVGTTSAYGGPARINVGFNQSTNFGITLRNTSATATGVFVSFENSSGGGNGSISQTNSTTIAYNTSSDRRLKTNISLASSASSDIDAIQVVSHGWVSNNDIVKYGVIAQDLELVAPQAVTKGDDGEEIEKVWGVDYSKLVPMLIKEVQSLRKRLADAGL